VCKTLTSYIFYLYLKAPQTWYNLFPSTLSILLVLFISSLLTSIPVVCFLKIIKIFFNSFVVWKVWWFFQNILHILGFFLHKKPRNSIIFQFVSSDKNLPPKKVPHQCYMTTNTLKFPTYFADHSRKGRWRASGQMASKGHEGLSI